MEAADAVCVPSAFALGCVLTWLAMRRRHARLIRGLAERCAGQAEALSRRAEKAPPPVCVPRLVVPPPEPEPVLLPFPKPALRIYRPDD